MAGVEAVVVRPRRVRPRRSPRPNRRRPRRRARANRRSRAGRAKEPEAAAAAPADDEAPPVAEAAAPESFDPDDVIEAWPTVLEGLKAPLKAVVQHAQPIGVERGIVVFGVPRPRFDAINGRFRSEAETIKEAFSSQLGFAPGSCSVRMTSTRPAHCGRWSTRSAPSAEVPGAAAVVDVTEEEPEIDLNELVDVPDAPPPDTVARLVSDLGAQVVEERPRSMMRAESEERS